MTDFRRVSGSYWLHLPPWVGGRERVWLAPGGVIDAGDPFIAQAIVGQEHKLEAAPAGAQPAPLTHRGLLLAQQEWHKKHAPREVAAEKQAERAEVAAARGIPQPDARPRKPKP